MEYLLYNNANHFGQGMWGFFKVFLVVKLSHDEAVDCVIVIVTTMTNN